MNEKSKRKIKALTFIQVNYGVCGGCEESLNSHREDAALYRGVGLSSSRVNTAEALSPAWWISSGSGEATRRTCLSWSSPRLTHYFSHVAGEGAPAFTAA